MREATERAEQPAARVAEHYVRDYFRGVFPDEPDYFVRQFQDAVGSDFADVVLDQLAAAGVALGESLVLDVGAGLGGLVRAAQARGARAAGVEPAEVEVRLAAAVSKETARPQTFVVADGARLPLGDRSMDVVTLIHVLEHTPAWRHLLAEAARVLRPGGALFALAPDYYWTFHEPHYHVAWAPRLPRALARPYLRLRGRRTWYLDQCLFPLSAAAVRAELRALGFQLQDLRLYKLRHPEALRSPRARRVAALVGRLGLLSAAERLLALPFVVPSLQVIAWRSGPGRVSC